MKPEDFCDESMIRRVDIHSTPAVLYDADGESCVLSAKNDRGVMEVLIAPDRKAQALALAGSGSPLSLTGYFRRRSGRRADGRRHFVWCLVLLTAAVKLEPGLSA